MKNLLFIFLLFPLLVFGQAEKTHRSIIIDSIKAFNGGIIDVKDTLKQDIGIKFNDGTFQSTAAVGGADGDGIYDGNGSIPGPTVVTIGANLLTFSGNAVTFGTATTTNNGIINIGLPGTGTHNGLKMRLSTDVIVANLVTSTGAGIFQLYDNGVNTIALQSNTSSFFTNEVKFGGNFTTSGASSLQVKGSNSKSLFRGYDANNAINITLKAFTATGGQMLLLGAGGATTTIAIDAGATSFFNGGNVGIGLNSGISARLHVSGINATNANISFKASDNTGVTPLLVVRNGGNIGIGTEDQFGNGVLVIGITNAITVPSANPTGGGILYVEGGALKYRGSSGTVTTIANP